jgi:extensin-like protein
VGRSVAIIAAVAVGVAVAVGCGGTAGAVPAATPKPATSPRKAATNSRKPAKRPSKPAKHRASGMSSSTAAHLTSPSDAKTTPAVRYAQLSQDDCEAELTTRKIDFVRETGPAVLAPVRMTGALHGVVFRTDARDKDRPTSKYEIADCRLVLALDDFAEILSRHDIVEVRHYSMYRPPRSWPEGKLGTRHDGALAIDAGRFIDKAGAVLDVDRDFHGAIDAPTCGDGAAPKPATPAALTLRAILCDAVDHRLFNVVLTPNYNRPHKNHFHLEVTAGVAWFLVH